MIGRGWHRLLRRLRKPAPVPAGAGVDIAPFPFDREVTLDLCERFGFIEISPAVSMEIPGGAMGWVSGKVTLRVLATEDPGVRLLQKAGSPHEQGNYVFRIRYDDGGIEYLRGVVATRVGRGDPMSFREVVADIYLNQAPIVTHRKSSR